MKTEEVMIDIQGDLSRFIKARRNGRGKGLKIEKQEELKESKDKNEFMILITKIKWYMSK